MDNLETVYFSLWVGGEPSLYEQLSYLSFSKSAKFKLFTYSNYDLPTLINQVSAEEIVSKFEFDNFQGNYAEFSDYFRYVALSRLSDNHTWIDGDVLFNLGESQISPYLFGLEQAGNIGIGILRVPSNSKMLPQLIAGALDATGGAWGSTGPVLFTNVAKEHSLFELAIAREAFYAMDIHQINLLIDPKELNRATEIFANSIFVHFYSQMLRNYHIPRNKLPPKNSYLYLKFQEYAAEIDAETLSLTWIALWKIYFKVRTWARRHAKIIRKLRRFH